MAKRDLTEKQMRKVAAEQGFEPWALGLWDISDEAIGRVSYGWVMFRRNGHLKVHYRTSIAEAIRKRKIDREKKSVKAAA